MLGARLAVEDPLARRAAVLRWAAIALPWQAVVIVAGIAWTAFFALRHPRGYLWGAPPLGLLLGTAAPLQFVAMSIVRSLRR